jgi:hypothetical protein
VDKGVRRAVAAALLARLQRAAVDSRPGFPVWAATGGSDTAWRTSGDGDWTGGFSVAALWLAARTGTGGRDDAVEAMDRLAPALETSSAFRGFLFCHGAAFGDVLFGDRQAAELAVDGARRLAAAAHPVTAVIPLGEPDLLLPGGAGETAYVDAGRADGEPVGMRRRPHRR